jgi:uncharacterized cupredoxin-like copper-binding protein
VKRSSLTAASVALFLGAAIIAAVAHEGEHFSAGEPGNPKKPARTVTVTISDSDGMKFTPDHLDVKKGEQVHFIIENKGSLKHEFTLASVQDNDKHAKLMQKYPDMEHDDPNAKSVDAGKSAEILWRFGKTGTFEFACLIPGHREAGMRGAVIVK